MNIYNYTNYKSYIKDWVEAQKNLGMKVTYSSLADIARIQKTYLSKVINDLNVHLSQDQTFLISEYIGHNDNEKQYFELLLDYMRTDLIARKKDLKRKINELKSKELKPENHLKVNNLLPQEDFQEYSHYHLDPWNQIIHMALTIPYFQKSPLKIASSLHMPEEEFTRRLQLLKKIGVISIDKKISVLKDSLHLSRQSPSFWPWHKQISSSSHERSRLQNNEIDLNFSVTFTANEDVFNQIKVKFLSFMESCQSDVKSAPSEKLYQLNFDLIDWRL